MGKMTLSDAINHLRETLSDIDHDWGCSECKEEHEQLLVWLEELDRTKQINTNYKVLLQAAFQTMSILGVELQNLFAAVNEIHPKTLDSALLDGTLEDIKMLVHLLEVTDIPDTPITDEA